MTRALQKALFTVFNRIEASKGVRNQREVERWHRAVDEQSPSKTHHSGGPFAPIFHHPTILIRLWNIPDGDELVSM